VEESIDKEEKILQQGNTLEVPPLLVGETKLTTTLLPSPENTALCKIGAGGSLSLLLTVNSCPLGNTTS
jgi:hypothetical protein